MKKTLFSLLLLAGSCAVYAQSTETNTSTNTTGSTVGTAGTVNNMQDTVPTGTNSTINNNTNVNTTNNVDNGVNSNNMSTTSIYNAYGTTTVSAPANIQNYMMRDYPTATDVRWTQQGDFYHGTYMTNGRYNHVYYNEAGNTYTLSLPVTQTWVPDDVLNKVSSMFGSNVYDVTMIKGADKQNVYHVRLLEGGQLRSQFFGEDGSAINDPFVTEHNLNVGAGNANTDVNAINTSTDDMNNSENSVNNTDQSQQNGNNAAQMKIKPEGNKTKIVTKTEDGKKHKVKMKDGKLIEKHDQ